MSLLEFLIISLLLLGGSIYYAWKKGVKDITLFFILFLMCTALYLILLSNGIVWLK